MIELSSHPCFLGWYKPGSDGQTQIGLATERFGRSDIETYNRTIGVIADLRPALIDFLALEADYETLKGLSAELCAFSFDDGPVTIAGVDMVMAYARTHQALSNFLNAAKAFKDRTLYRLSVRDGQARPSKDWNLLQQLEAQAYEDSLAVRILTHLSRYALVQPSPVTILPVSEPPTAESEPVIIDMRIVLDIEALMASETIDARLKVELKAMREKRLNVLPLVDDYMRVHGEIMLSIIESKVEDLFQLEQFEARIIEHSNPPEGAIPIIWQGAHPQEGSLDGSAFHFCFDESRFLFDLAKRLSGMV